MKIKKPYKILFLAITILAIVFLACFLSQKNVTERSNDSNVTIYENELDIVFGLDSASLKVFLFSSYNCSFCRKFFKNVYPELKKDFIDKGKVKLILKPVELSRNKSIINSLQIAVCVNEYGNFEKLHQLLLTEPTVVFTPEFKTVIDELTEKDLFVAECMYGGQSEKYISNNLNTFLNLNLAGTPTFIINNKIYKGYKDYDRFKNIIEKELNNTL